MALDTEVAQRAHKLCHELDTEGTGALDPAKLHAVLKEVSPESDDVELQALVRSVDINEDGVVQYDEFLRWLRFPPTASGVKLSFEESLRSGMLDRIKLDGEKDEPVKASRDTLAPSPVGDVGAKDAMKPSTEEEDDILMDAFVHPLLERFSVCKDDAPAPGVLCVRVDTSARREGGSLRRVDGKLEVTAAECTQANSLSELLVALSQAYKALLDTFLESSDSYKGLRIPLIPAVTKYGAPIKRATAAKPFWSAVALALAQLSSRQLASLKDQCVEVQPGALSSGLGDTLAAKVTAGKSLAIDDTRARLPMRKDGYGWCRRDNDGDARLWRLEAFVLTQRAVYARGFTVPPGKEVCFENFHPMLCGTKVFIPGPSNFPEDAAPAVTFEVQTLQELELPIGETVMEVAAHFMKQGCQVAAINAASAYQVGGGASTGGRHALEEAWCISSSLYQSLASVEPMKTGGLPGYRQHIPVTGCIVSPHVEVFREPTDDGYGFLDAAQPLTGVVSVAMFNRNPRVRDSPLDSPEQPAEYLKQTRSKLEAALLAAVEVLNAEVIIVPDVGCGVFGNDPYIIGGCLGSVLRRHSHALQAVKKVVITGRRNEFSDACLRALKGQDPRPPRGAADSGHPARYSQAAAAEGASDPSIVDEALLELAKHPPEQDEKRLHPCRYGASCHIRTADHLARYSHPETDASRARGISGTGGTSAARGAPATGSTGSTGSTGAAGRTTLGAKVAPTRPRSAHDKPSDPGPSGPRAGLAEPPSDDRRVETPNPEMVNPAVEPGGGGGSVSSRSARPICRYGEACYNSNPKHLADFSHPWLEGESDDQAQARRDQQDCHDLLNKAKAGKWEEVQSGLLRNPRLLDMRPDSRKFALIHYAAFQFHVGGVDMLLKFGADPALKNQDGKTALELVRSELKAIPAHDLKHQKMAQDCLLRLRRYDTPVSKGGGPSATVGATAAPTGPGAGAAGAGASEAAGGLPPGKATGARPASKVCRTYIMVAHSPAVDLNGEYLLLDEKAQDRDVYRKVVPSARGTLHIFYHKNPKKGWSVGYDPASYEDPLAYLGPSSASDPCSKSYCQFWEVQLSYTFGTATRYYMSPSSRMMMTKQQRTE